MSNDVSKQHWENIYTNKSVQDVSWFQAEPTISLNIIQNISDNKAQIIDVGSGTSTLVDHLLKLGYTNLAALDISGKAIEIVKKRLLHHANKVEWYENDITEFTPLHTYDIWHDRAVFHFLTTDIARAAYKKALMQSTTSGSHAIIATFAKDGPQKCTKLNIMQHDNASIKQEFGDEFVLLQNQLETHRTPNGSEQRFIYFVLRRK